MSDGTKYLTKIELIDAIKALIYDNTTYEISPDDVQTSCLDIVESLWDLASDTLVESISYTDLISKKDSSELIPGRIYSFTYQCKHLIPGTSIEKTAPTTETFLTVATSTNLLSSIIRSKDNPNDIIYIDFTSNTVEGGSTARTGKVFYRKDILNNLETYYDFRGVYFKRRTASPSEMITNGATVIPPGIATNYTTKHVGIASGTDIYIKIGSKDGVTDINTTDKQWMQIPNVNKWMYKDTCSIGGIVFRQNNSDTEEVLTFTGICSDISIGKTTSNNGYNNISFNNCTNITIPAFSYDGYFDNCSNSIIKDVCRDIYAINVHRSTLDNVQSDFFNKCFDSNIGSKGVNFFEDIMDTTINQIGNSIISYCTDSTIGNDANLLSSHHIEKSNISNYISNVFLQHLVKSSIGNYFTNSTAIGMNSCIIGNNCSSFDIDAPISSYTTFQSCIFENDITTVELTGTNNITNLVVRNKSSNIAMNDVYISNLIIHERCSNIDIDTASIYDTVINAENSNFTIGNSAYDTYLSNSVFKESNSSVTLYATNATEFELGIGNISVSFTGTTAKSLSKTKIGNRNNGITFSESNIIQCLIGNSNIGININSINCTGLIIENDCTSLTFNTEDIYWKKITQHTSTKTFNGSTTVAGDIHIVNENPVANNIELFYQNTINHSMYYVECSAAFTTDHYNFPKNKEFSIYVKNISAGNITVTFGDYDLTIGAGLTYLVKLIIVNNGVISDSFNYVSSVKVV